MWRVCKRVNINHAVIWVKRRLQSWRLRLSSMALCSRSLSVVIGQWRQERSIRYPWDHRWRAPLACGQKWRGNLLFQRLNVLYRMSLHRTGIDWKYPAWGLVCDWAGRCVQRFHTEFGMSHAMIAEVVGKARTTVSNLLRLNQLHDTVKDHLANAPRYGSCAHAFGIILSSSRLSRKNYRRRYDGARRWKVGQIDLCSLRLKPIALSKRNHVRLNAWRKDWQIC